MQDVLRTARPRTSNLPVNVPFSPLFEQFRLVLRQIGLHREVRPGQIDGLFEIDFLGFHGGHIPWYQACWKESLLETKGHYGVAEFRP